MDIKNEIVKHIGTLSVNGETGWQIEFNLVSWNGKSPRYEVRPWSPDHEKCRKVCSFSKADMEKLIPMMEAELEK